MSRFVSQMLEEQADFSHLNQTMDRTSEEVKSILSTLPGHLHIEIQQYLTVKGFSTNTSCPRKLNLEVGFRKASNIIVNYYLCCNLKQ